MNNTLEGIRSRITEAEEQINDLEDRMGNHCYRTKYRQREKQTKKLK